MHQTSKLGLRPGVGPRSTGELAAGEDVSGSRMFAEEAWNLQKADILHILDLFRYTVCAFKL